MSTNRNARKTYIIDDFEELPEELRKRVLKSEITQEEANKHLEILLNILHFKTKQNFYTTELYENKAPQKVRRYNKDHSLINKSIVSVAPLSQEAKTLLVPFPKKNYTILDEIGKGGFGRVFLTVESGQQDSPVAVKRMPHVTTKQKRKNFQEIRFLKYCNGHPNIIGILRSTLYKDEIWMATEFLNGGTLSQIVASHQCTEPQIRYITREILVALFFLHQNALAHRDLKSANIMLDLNGNLKIIDFGLCSDISQGHVVHMVGSPFWMPPEMIKREPHGLLVDVWSFGICLMECANGHPPNRKSTLKAMFVAATEGYPDPFANPLIWSPFFKDFLSKCLHTNPEKRATVIELQKHEWFLQPVASKSEIADICKEIFKKKKEN